MKMTLVDESQAQLDIRADGVTLGRITTDGMIEIDATEEQLIAASKQEGSTLVYHRMRRTCARLFLEILRLRSRQG